jgi:HK97 gp10 family phage protein
MQIKVRGLKEVEAQLLKLGSKEGTKVLRAAMLRATKPIQDEAKSNAAAIPNGSGALEKSIGRRFEISGRGVFGEGLLPNLGGKFNVSIAPLRSSRVAIALYNLFYQRKRKRRGIFHGHFVEFGIRGPARHILSRALNSRGPQAVSTLADEIKSGIDRLLAKR